MPWRYVWKRFLHEKRPNEIGRVKPVNDLKKKMCHNNVYPNKYVNKEGKNRLWYEQVWMTFPMAIFICDFYKVCDPCYWE